MRNSIKSFVSFKPPKMVSTFLRVLHVQNCLYSNTFFTSSTVTSISTFHFNFNETYRNSPREQIKIIHPRRGGGLEYVAPDEVMLAVHQVLPGVGSVKRVIARPVQALLCATFRQVPPSLGHSHLCLCQPALLHQPFLLRHHRVVLKQAWEKQDNVEWISVFQD